MSSSLSTINDLPDATKAVVSIFDHMFDEIYLVGGAVRDAILGRDTKDIDFAVPNSANEIEIILSKNPLLHVHTEGKRYGTISASIDEYDIQITSYRSELYIHGSRKPIVSSTCDIDSDLSRRDFSINAMALSREEFVDPYDGYTDIKRKIIRTVGNPDVKIKEDPLRILRAFRFVSNFGYQIEETTLKAIVDNRGNLQIVSSERQGEELKKILAGKYWADTLNELAEANVLQVLLRCFDFTYKVTVEDVRHEFEKFSTAELEAMDIVRRWCYLVRILEYSEKASGITSTDIEATAETILSKSQVPKGIKTEVAKAVIAEKNTENSANLTNTIDSVRRELAILKAANDPRAMIEEAKYYTLTGQDELRESNFSAARKCFRSALDITEENYVFIIGFNDEEKKRASLKGITPYYLTRLKYYFSSIILDEKLYAKYDSTDKLLRYIEKKEKIKYAGKKDIEQAIDSAIAYVYRQNIHNIQLEPYFDFLNKPGINLTPDQRERYLMVYIDSKIRSHATSIQDRAKLYLEKAKIAAKGKEPSERGLEYYDPYIDYLYSLMLCQTNLAKFYNIYEKFNDVTEEYIKLTKKENRLWAGERKYFLTSASSLVYALSLTGNIEQKLEISQHITADYSSAGRGFEKNRQRYQIYVEWFSFVDSVLKSTYSTQVIKDTYQLLKSFDSIRYVDVDEEYLTNNKPDIVKVRGLIRDSLKLTSVIAGLNNPLNDPIDDKAMVGIAYLTEAGIITESEAFTLFKNYLSMKENEQIDSERIELSDRELKQKEINEVEEYLTGESETIEYKSSWAFELGRYRESRQKDRKNSDELKKEVIKNIAGLMNKNGGILFIGVEDDCNVCGLEETDFLMQSSKDPRKKLDNIQLDIRNSIMNMLSKEALAEISIEAISYKEKTVIRIKIPITKNGPVIYREGDDEKYYVRSGTSTTNAGLRAVLNKYVEQKPS